MPRLAYFVSSHGLGHAARASAVVEALSRRAPELTVDVFGTSPAWFWEESTQARVRLRTLEHDPGLVQHDALRIDHEATLRRLAGRVPPGAEVLDSIVQLLRRERHDAVICDVSPLGLAAGRGAGLPTILIENFTWDWIYSEYAGDLPDYRPAVDWVAEEVDRCSLHLQCIPVCRPAGRAATVAPIARARRSPAAVRGLLGVDPDERLILMSMGGIVHRFDNLAGAAAIEARFLVLGETGEGGAVPANCTILPRHSGLYHPDLIAAADVVVGKLGYSTLAEALAAGTGFGFVERAGFPESRVLAEYAAGRLATARFSSAEFAYGSWLGRLGGLLRTERSPEHCATGAAQAAEAIAARLGWERATL